MQSAERARHSQPPSFLINDELTMTINYPWSTRHWSLLMTTDLYLWQTPATGVYTRCFCPVYPQWDVGPRRLRGGFGHANFVAGGGALRWLPATRCVRFRPGAWQMKLEKVETTMAFQGFSSKPDVFWRKNVQKRTHQSLNSLGFRMLVIVHNQSDRNDSHHLPCPGRTLLRHRRVVRGPLGELSVGATSPTGLW